MVLPVIKTPTYELILPSTEKTIKYRPFLVKEEKILLIALESKDEKQITSAVKTVLKDCILTRGIKVEELPTFDIEYIFLNVRGKSVGESIDLIITCSDDGVTEVPVTIYVDEIQVQKDPKHTADIQLDDKLFLRLKYPSLDRFIETNFNFKEVKSISNIDKSFEIITSCIDMVYDNDTSWSASDCTKKELIDYIETMTNQQFKLIEEFFDTMPKLLHNIKVVNPKTGVENEVTLEGLSSFFG